MKKTKKVTDQTEMQEAAEDVVLEKSSTEPEEKPMIEKNIQKVGSLLKEMRIQKGLKINDVAKKLCIRQCYIEAIEESRYQDIPEFPYGAGFIRSYAEFLGLNSSNIIELYKDETNVGQDKNIYVLEPQTEATVPGKKYILISVIALAAVYFAWYSYNNTTTNEETPVATEENMGEVEELNPTLPIVVDDYNITDENVVSNPQPSENAAPEIQQITVTNESFVEPTSQAKEPKTEPKAKVEESQVEAAQQNAQPEPKTEPKQEPLVKPTANFVAGEGIPSQGVVVEVLDETWIEVKDAEKLYLSKVLQPGTRYTVPEGKGMILSAGKVKGVNVYINGKLTPFFSNEKKMNIPLDKFLNSGNH